MNKKKNNKKIKKMSAREIEGFGLFFTLLAVLFQFGVNSFIDKKENIKYQSLHSSVYTIPLDIKESECYIMQNDPNYPLTDFLKYIANRTIIFEELFVNNLELNNPKMIKDLKNLNSFAKKVNDIHSFGEFRKRHVLFREKYAGNDGNDYRKTMNKINIFSKLFYMFYILGLGLILYSKFKKE